jgi:polar amino acid transport system substrate-binding protein
MRLTDLEGGKKIAVPTGTAADQLTLKRFPDAKIEYYNTIYDCALAVSGGKAEATVYDKPVLQNLAAKTGGLTVLEELLMPDQYGFAVIKENRVLKVVIDTVLYEIKGNGIYKEMSDRWFPEQGAPVPMPDLVTNPVNGILRFGTAAMTEPMSFMDKDRKIVGFDVEFAYRIAQKLGKRLEIVNLEFGAMLPALIAGKVDMIGAGLSITPERAKKVLFSQCYYESGIAAMVKKPDGGKIPATQAKTTPESFAPPKKLGVLMGSIHDAYATKTYPDATIYPYNTMPDMLLALQSGKVGGAFVDETSLKEIFSKNPNFMVLKNNLFVTDIAAGFRKRDSLVRMQFNLFLKEIKQNGTYDAMVDRWMKQDDAEIPVIPAGNPDGNFNIGIVSDIGLPFAVKSGGKWKGFDAELSMRFAASLGKNAVMTDLPFGSLLPSLVSGKIDIITASMMITAERKKQIDFTDPYYSAGATMIGCKTGKAQSSVVEGESKQVKQAAEADKVIANTSFTGKFTDSFHNNIVREKRYMMIVNGLLITILISLFSAVTGTILGGLICFMRMSKNKFFNWFSLFYISLVRGTPVLVLLMIIYYVVFASVNINPVAVAIIAFGFNFAAYVSEMFRSSIESIDKGQNEAGVASGFTKVQTFIYIIMPQALRNVLPVYKGEFISLVKMTSVVGYIAVEDLTKASDIIRSRTFDAFFPLIMAAVIYILIAWLLTLALDYVEISVDPKRRRLNFKIAEIK